MVSASTSHADVIVVGAGVVGCASAYFLAEAFDRVVVLERGQVGMGASFGNAGHLTPGDAIPLAAPGIVGQALRWAIRPDSPFSMSWKLTPSYVAWLASFARWSRRGMDARIDALKALAELSLDLVELTPEADRSGFEYRRAGVLNVYQTGHGLSSGVDAAGVLRRHGIQAEQLDAGEVRERSGFDGEVAGGVLFPNDAQCNPYAYVRHLAKVASQRGADIREGIGVRSVSASGPASFSVETSVGAFTSNAVVLAAGAATPELVRGLGVRVPIVAGRGCSMDVALAPEPRLPLLFHERRLAVNNIGGKTRFAGLMEIGKRSNSVGGRKAAYLVRSARELFSDASAFAPGPVWSGLRPCTPDGLPIVGPVPGHRNLLIAAGHAMVGMTLGAGTGRLVADIIRGERPAISSSAFAIERF
jgi:D-amino-acid dehydrogenase